MSRRDDQTLLRDMIEAARSAVSAIEGTEQAALAADSVRSTIQGELREMRTRITPLDKEGAGV